VLLLGSVSPIFEKMLWDSLKMSNGVGAEIQRSLASVIVGGLVKATLLPYLVLPVFYAWFSKSKIKELTNN
jgi:Cu/Ag efflux pump CusA